MTKAQAQHIAAMDSARTSVAQNVYTFDNGESYVSLPQGSYIPKDVAVWICTYENGSMTRHK